MLPELGDREARGLAGLVTGTSHFLEVRLSEVTGTFHFLEPREQLDYFGGEVLRKAYGFQIVTS